MKAYFERYWLKQRDSAYNFSKFYQLMLGKFAHLSMKFYSSNCDYLDISEVTVVKAVKQFSESVR